MKEQIQSLENEPDFVVRSEQFYCESEKNGGKRCDIECKSCKTIPAVIKRQNSRRNRR